MLRPSVFIFAASFNSGLIMTIKYSFEKRHFLILVFVLGVFVLSGQDLQKNISLSVHQKRIPEVLRIIEKQHNVVFSYNSSLIPEDKRVTVSVTDQPLGDILDKLFLGLSVGVSEIDGHLILYKHVQPKGTKKITKRKKEDVPVRQVVRYVYDTITREVIDTVVLYRYDTLLVQDTIIYTDTLRIAAFEEQDNSKFSLNLSVGSVSPFLNITNPDNKTDKKGTDPKSASGLLVSHLYLTGTYYFNKHINLSFGIGAETMQHNSYIQKPAEIAVNNIETQYERPYFATITDTLYDVKYYSYGKIPFGGTEVTTYYDSVVSIDGMKSRTVEMIELRDTVISETDTISPEIDDFISRQALYITMPCIAGYKLPIGKRFAVEFQAGMFVSVLLKSRVAINEDQAQDDNSYWNKVQLRSFAGIDVSYKLSKRFSFNAGANCGAFLGSQYNGELLLGRYAGLKYYF